MQPKRFVIVGATGQIGFVLVEDLVKKGHGVLALGRDQKKLKALEQMGAHTRVVDLTRDSLHEPFIDADAVFSFIPPNFTTGDYAAYQDTVGKAIEHGIRAANVKYAVNLSSVGAQFPSGLGPVNGLYRQEQRLNGIAGLNVVHLRPTYFMENLLWSVALIKQTGSNGSPIAKEIVMPMVETDDIGHRAAELFDGLNFNGQTAIEYVGPRDLTLVDATRAIGKAIGKPDLKYVQFSLEESRNNLLKMGASASVADAYVEMYQGINQGKLTNTQKIAPENRGKTTIEEFAKIFAKVYQK